MASTYELIVQATDKSSGPLRKIERSLGGVEKQVNSVNTALKAAGGAIIAFATGSALKGIVNQYTAFEKYRTVLATYLGSQEKANKALKDLQQIANNLPQDLDDITQAFVVLNRFGIDTSAKSLTRFSNIATANGKSLTQLAEAVADGMAGEFERFKEFGIKVSNESGKLTAAIGNDVVATANNAKDLVSQLAQLGETRFGDAAANNADTLGQSLSNLRGAITEAVIAFGEGLAPALKQVADQTAEYVRLNRELIGQLGAGVGEALRTLASAATFVTSNIELLTSVFKAFLTLKVLQFFTELTGRMIRYTNGARTATGVVSGMTKAVAASGTAALVAAGQFTGLNAAVALLATRAGMAAAAVAAIFYSASAGDADELSQIPKEATMNITAATEAMKNFAGTRTELDALIEKYRVVVQSVQSMMDAQDRSTELGTVVYNANAEALMAYNGALGSAIERTNQMAQAQGDVVTGANDYNKRLQELMKTIEGNIATQDFEKEALAQLTQEYDDGLISLRVYEEAKRLLEQTTNKTAEATKKELTFLQQLVKSRKEQIDNTLEIQRALSGENQQVKELAKQYGISEAEVRDALQDRLAGLIEVEERTIELGEKSKTAAEIMQDSFKQATEALGNNIARGLAQGKFALNDFKSFFDSFLEDILTAIIQKNITGPLVEGLTGGPGGGLLGGIAGALFGGPPGGLVGPPAPGGGFSFGGIFDGISNFFGGFFANGGMPPMNKVSVVGERGPELFVPSTRGTIVPNEALNSGGQPVVVNFNINAIDTQTGVEFIVEQRDTISAVVSDALNKQGRRGIVA